MTPFRLLLFFCPLFLLFILPTPAYAYLDPGTGSMLVSALVGIAATVFFLAKGMYYRGTSFFYELIGKKNKQQKTSFVVYCEGSQYWNVFRPILDALSARGEDISYLTSDENDPGLKYNAKDIRAKYIGKGNRAYSYMNMLEADVCIMTTPGLDVLQIHRSPGVKHYAHVVHMPGEVTQYRRYGLDYYDSVFISGPHQEKSIRAIEAKRNIAEKQIFRSGCTYYDILVPRKEALQKDTVGKKDGIHILIAPTWGVNGLLSRYGMKLIQPLADAGYTLVVRPHPQSRTHEPALLEELQAATANLPNVSWDKSPDNFVSLSNADIFISDYSGITFDFAYVMERPVLTMEFTPNLDPFDAYDLLPELPWNFTAPSKIGKRIGLDEVQYLPKIIEEFMADEIFTQKIRTFRDANLYNFGCAGEEVAKGLIAIRDELRKKENAEKEKK